MAKVAHGVKVNFDAPTGLDIKLKKGIILIILILIFLLGKTIERINIGTKFDTESVYYQQCERDCYMNSHDIQSCLNYCRMKYINKGEKR